MLISTEHGNIETMREELRKLEEQQRKLNRELAKRSLSEERDEAVEVIDAWLQTFPAIERVGRLNELLEDDVMCRECGPGTLRIIYYFATVVADMQGKLLELREYDEAEHFCEKNADHCILHLSNYSFEIEEFELYNPT